MLRLSLWYRRLVVHLLPLRCGVMCRHCLRLARFLKSVGQRGIGRAVRWAVARSLPTHRPHRLSCASRDTAHRAVQSRRHLANDRAAVQPRNAVSQSASAKYCRVADRLFGKHRADARLLKSFVAICGVGQTAGSGHAHGAAEGFLWTESVAVASTASLVLDRCFDCRFDHGSDGSAEPARLRGVSRAPQECADADHAA